MKNYIDSKGNVYGVDMGKNLFKDGKCINPKEQDAEGIPLPVCTDAFIEDNGLKPLSPIITGHVGNFHYGYGDNKVGVCTGHESW